MNQIDCNRFCEAMGTRFEVFLFGHDKQHLSDVSVAVLDEIVRLDELLSRYDPRSEISRVNREAAHSPVRVDWEVFSLLNRCELARGLTDGFFDVTAPGYKASRETGELPALQLDAETRTVRFTHPEVAIDLGGIGKGYALDRGREIMLRFGVRCGLLHGGTSSVLTPGTPPNRADNAGWPVAVRHPLSSEPAPVAQVDLIDRGLSCSAVRDRIHLQSDVVNPRTGHLLSGVDVCVVLAASATEAEIFSTALLAMGRERAIDYLAGRPDSSLNVGWFEPGDEFEWVETG